MIRFLFSTTPVYCFENLELRNFESESSLSILSILRMRIFNHLGMKLGSVFGKMTKNLVLPRALLNNESD